MDTETSMYRGKMVMKRHREKVAIYKVKKIDLG